MISVKFRHRGFQIDVPLVGRFAKQNFTVDFYTPWKINMEPENHLFEKEIHLPTLHFWVPC